MANASSRPSFAKRARRKFKNTSRVSGETLPASSNRASTGPISFAFLNLRLARFAKLGRDDAFANEQIRQFYEDIALGITARGIVRLTVLKIGDDIASIAYGILAEDSFCGLASAINSDKFYKHSPSMLLMLEDIKKCREAGLTYFDFTLGDEEYKFRFNVEVRSLDEIHYPITWRGHVSYQLRKLKHVVRKYPRLLALTKKIRGK